uniref:Adenine DNA glycosylase n=1 Tax=Lingulaulax polyedra TaxID=160621 RepID=A0A516AG53_LINPO|nr:adenine DNA glycosylase [Lingulodinium polyedra]
MAPAPAAAAGPAPHGAGAGSSAPPGVVDIEDLAAGAGADGGWDGAEPVIRRRLLAWYAAGRRRLPWRGDPPPWSVEKAALRQAAAAEAAARQQPSIRSFFAKRLRCGEAPGAPPLQIDLEEEEAESPRKPPAAAGDLASSEEQPTGAQAGAFPASAYGTWVSEVMLQQTQVERVVEYWARWMRRFPTVRALAEADAEAVNAAWAGLGFYGRARRLHEGAKHLLALRGGEVPGDLEGLRRVPGVGPYTAGAVASIAFGRRAAAVDGNVARVFARLRALEGDAASAGLLRRCWELAEQLVDPSEPGAFNQALMELGATVCTPQAPACGRCPVRQSCRAADLVASGAAAAVTDWPGRAAKKPPKLRSFAVAVLQDAAGRVLLVRRPAEGLLAGQWEFPCVPLHEAAGPQEEASMLQAMLRGEFSWALPAELPELAAAKVPPVEHAFSHERHTMRLFRGRVQQDVAAGQGACEGAGLAPAGRPARWLTPAEADALGVTSGVHKVLAALDLKPAASPGARPAKRPRPRRGS